MGNDHSKTKADAVPVALQQNHDRQRPMNNSNNSNSNSNNSNAQPGTFLWGCNNAKEHRFKKALLIQILRPLKGERGLIASGLEYRTVTFRDDGALVVPPDTMTTTTTTTITSPPGSSSSAPCECRARVRVRSDSDSNFEEEKKEESPHHASISAAANEQSCSCREQTHRHHQKSNANTDAGINANTNTNTKTMSRLFHKESNTMVTKENRKRFIADGHMYDIVARLAMEYAQEVMMRDAQLEWVTVPHELDDNDNGNGNGSASTTTTTTTTNPPTTNDNKNKHEKEHGHEPIRALVSTRLVKDEGRIDNEPTLLIATGKGYVRAGVFSRQHLLTSGLELGSAVPYVREAHRRNMHVVVLDPNAHGDRVGMATFSRSMDFVFRRWERTHKNTDNGDRKGSSAAHESESEPELELPPPSPQSSPSSSSSSPQSSSSSSQSSPQSPATEQHHKNLFVLSHSQSGAQLVRYLMNKSHCYLPRIRATAFTDSTHNIQWAKRSSNLNSLKEHLESEECVYFKRSTDEDKDCIHNPLSSIGQPVETDSFWKHRFGEIRTLCAGTSDHSLTNWFVRHHIWEHFDRRLTHGTSEP